MNKSKNTFNSDYLFKGLKKNELIKDANNNKWVESNYKYMHTKIEDGVHVPLSNLHCFSGYYPSLAQEDKYFYEGLPNYSIHTQKRYIYGKNGNVIEYQDLGDTEDASDNVKAIIMYDSIPSIHAMALAKNISVYHGSDLIRSRSAEYDNLGRLTSITLNHDGEQSFTSYTYNVYGNISKVIQPADSYENKKEINILYDNVVNTYPILITDESHFSSNTEYDFKFGKPIKTTDISGNYMNYNYYPDGRLESIKAPYEVENNIPYTIKFEYWDNHSHLWGDDDNVPWARTLHYDPANGNNLISTILFSDGLGRAIQTKKKSVVYNPDNDNENTMMVVSGKVSYDAFGRKEKAWYPITEDMGTDSIFNPNIDTQDPSINTYDVLDRAITTTAPDQTTTNMSYGFGIDKYGATRFKTLQTDALENITQQFKDPRGLQTTVIDALNGTTAFVYSPLGELLSSTDPEGNITTHTYDQLGRKIQTTHPDAGTSNFVYDNANNLISMQTQNLINESKQINYVYSYNKLMEIHYPNYPQNDVYYQYGDHHAGNNAGRIIKQQDASGVQTFKYGKLGELIGNIHTFVVPGGETYTFAMNWKYDSWNRLQTITYPDGEVVIYKYNLSGQLYAVIGTKTTRTFNYLNSVTYDKFGNRCIVENGNGTSQKYTYDATTLRLSNLKSYNGFGEMMQNINYTYDDVSNITQIKNNAPVMTNGLGGASRYDFAYDNMYRLETSTGHWGNKDFSLTMQYSASGNILNKTQYAKTSINGRAIDFDYNRSYNYNGSQPHAISNIDGSDIFFDWDANGNMILFRKEKSNLNRRQCWDEENRMIAVRDERYLSNYLYDAAGERVWKLSGQVQQMLINNEEYVDFADMNENKTLYANPYMVVNDREYTKHYYTEGQRIASKIGGGLSPSIVPYTDQIKSITRETYAVISDRLFKRCQQSNDCVKFNGEYTNYGKTIKCVKPLAEMDEPEKDVYFYHSDHIGSSSFITDRNGYASQHLQYLPFGELFVEQRSTANYYTPYKFSGKEKDEETSYSYFGARYYMSDVSVWLSVDPMREKYPSLSPYNYCALNPIIITDPDGMDIDPTCRGYETATLASTPGSSTYQPAFEELYNKWKDDPKINVQFINNMAESVVPNAGGTIDYGGIDNGGKDGAVRDIYKVFWNPEFSEELGTSGLFEEAKHLDDGLSGKFDIKNKFAGFSINNEVEAKQWVVNNIKGIKGTYKEGGYLNRTHYGYFKDNPTELTAQNLGLGIRLTNRNLDPRLNGINYYLFGTGGDSSRKLYTSSILRQVKKLINW